MKKTSRIKIILQCLFSFILLLANGCISTTVVTIPTPDKDAAPIITLAPVINGISDYNRKGITTTANVNVAPDATVTITGFAENKLGGVKSFDITVTKHPENTSVTTTEISTPTNNRAPTAIGITVGYGNNGNKAMTYKLSAADSLDVHCTAANYNGMKTELFVTFTILKAMDVVAANGVDYNGFPRNPIWGQMELTGQIPRLCDFCPCKADELSTWNASPNCTNQPLHVNAGRGWEGHFNYGFPVLYDDGQLTWYNHSAPGLDDDYSLNIARDDQSLYEDDAKCIGIEFDSSETVDYWDDTQTWWDEFHHKYVDDSNQAAGARINNKKAIVIGLLGFDTEHGAPVELHPVYAMFVHVQDDPAQDRWAFFVRNWGNEGYCGPNQEPLPTPGNIIKVLIPHSGGINSELIAPNIYVYGDDENERTQQAMSYTPVDNGMLFTFNLRDPLKKCGFVGDLTIKWGMSGIGSPPPHIMAKPVLNAPFSTEDRYEDGEMALKAKINKLNANDRGILYNEIKRLKHHSPPQRIQVTLSKKESKELIKPAEFLFNKNVIVKSVADPEGLASKDRIREFVLSFLKSHGIE